MYAYIICRSALRRPAYLARNAFGKEPQSIWSGCAALPNRADAASLPLQLKLGRLQRFSLNVVRSVPRRAFTRHCNPRSEDAPRAGVCNPAQTDIMHPLLSALATAAQHCV